MKAQTWSVDVMIAIVIFSVIILGFFYITGLTAQSERLKAMASEAEKVHESLTTTGNKSSLAFIEGGKIDSQKLAEFANMDYEEIKKQLGIEGGDFCIHLEDEEGNIVSISGKAGIGSGKVEISDNIYCNETIS